MTQPPAAVSTRKRSKIWRLLIWGFGLSLALGLGLSFYVMMSMRATRVRLDDMIARLDQTDPHWRLEDLEKDLPPVPENINSAALLKQIVASKPANWPAPTTLQLLEKLEPRQRLTAEQAAAVRAELERSPASMALIRQLAERTDCFFPTAWSADGIGTILPMVQPARDIVQIAALDVEHSLQTRQPDAACQSCRTMLSAGRCSGPGLVIPQALSRLSSQAACVDKVQRILAQSEPSEQALASLQTLLEQELREPLLERGIRCERATFYRALNGAFKDDPHRVLVATIRIIWHAQTDLLTKISSTVMAPSTGTLEANLATSLDFLTNLIESTKKPVREQDAEFDQAAKLGSDLRQPEVFRTLVPSLVKIRIAFQRRQAKLAAAITAIAAERYRMKHGSWPTRLDDIVPAELKQLPADPYTGYTLRMRKLSDGLVIYSVGFDKTDDGGTIEISTGEPPDIGFRLWDVKQRKVEPAPSREK